MLYLKHTDRNPPIMKLFELTFKNRMTADLIKECLEFADDLAAVIYAEAREQELQMELVRVKSGLKVEG